MPHAGKQSGIGQLEIFQETIRGDRIRQSNSVQNAILFHPGIQGIPVGICRIVLVIALPGTHDPFMRHGSHRCHIPFFCQIDIGRTRETASQTEFTEISKAIRSVHQLL